MLLRDRLLARLAEMGAAPDHQRLAAEVLGIRNAPPELARAARRAGAGRRGSPRRRGAAPASGSAAAAPATPGVYVLRDDERRGASTSARRSTCGAGCARTSPSGGGAALKAPFARVADAEWHEVGSEIEALLREASLIEELQPSRTSRSARRRSRRARFRRALVRDVIVVVPSVEPESAELVAARADGGWLIQRTRARRQPSSTSTRDAADALLPARRCGDRFESPRARADRVLVAGAAAARTRRGSIRTTPRSRARAARPRWRRLLADEALFTERRVTSLRYRYTQKFVTTSTARALSSVG